MSNRSAGRRSGQTGPKTDVSPTKLQTFRPSDPKLWVLRGVQLQIVREAFAPGARVALVARRQDLSRSQIYQWWTARREGRLNEPGSEIVGFVPVAMPPVPGAAPINDLPGTDSVTTGATIEIGLAGGRCLKVPPSLPTAELRRLIPTVEGTSSGRAPGYRNRGFIEK